MAAHRRPLIRAAGTSIREDRLTELLAVVLDSHRPFARRLMREADLPPGDDVEVSPQVSTPGGKRIDLQVVSMDAKGHPLGRLWSEHKTGSAFSTYQSQDDEGGLRNDARASWPTAIRGRTSGGFAPESAHDPSRQRSLASQP